MRCEKCHGNGKIYKPVYFWPEKEMGHLPEICEDCGGSGVSHCCEGDSACNDVEEKRDGSLEDA